MRLLPKQEIQVLTLGLALVVVMMIAIIVLALTRQTAITGELTRVAHEYNTHTSLANEMYRLARERTLLLQKITVEDDLFVQDELAMHYEALGTHFMEAHRHLTSQPDVAPVERELLAGLLETTRRTAAVQRAVIDHALGTRRVEAQKLLLREAVPLQDKVIDQLMELIAYSNAMTEKSVAEAHRIERSGMILLSLAGGAIVVLTIMIGFYIRRRMGNLTSNLESLVAARTQEIEEGAEIMERLTTAAMDAIVMIDDQDKIIFWNPAAERVFGHAPDAALGRKLHDLVMPARYRQQMEAGFATFTRAGQGAYIGRAREVEALHRDGHEFPMELSLSAVRIKERWVGIGLCRDITERKRIQDTLERMARTDSLTGLVNRRGFDATLNAEIKRAERHGQALSLALLDIDHFKAINDGHGHLAGDQILQAFAQLLTDNVRGDDILARWGGEEFALLSPNLGQEKMRLFAEKLREAIARHAFPAVGHLTCSIGVTEYRPGDTVDTFLNRADTALYAAKAGGRDRVESGG